MYLIILYKAATGVSLLAFFYIGYAVLLPIGMLVNLKWCIYIFLTFKIASFSLFCCKNGFCCGFVAWFLLKKR